MPKVTYVQPDGVRREVEAPAGTTLMEAAVDNDVQGIVAECGGACSCATCHVYVEPEWAERLPPPEPQEDGMLDCVLDRRPLGLDVDVTGRAGAGAAAFGHDALDVVVDGSLHQRGAGGGFDLAPLTVRLNVGYLRHGAWIAICLCI